MYIYIINYTMYLYYILYLYGGSHFKLKPKKSHSGLFPFSGLPPQGFGPPPHLAQGRPRKVLKKS